MVTNEILQEWIKECNTRSRENAIVLIRNIIINYIYLNIETQQKYIAEFLNFDRSTISSVTQKHSKFMQNKLYKYIYESLFATNLKEIFLKFVSENK